MLLESPQGAPPPVVTADPLPPPPTRTGLRTPAVAVPVQPTFAPPASAEVQRLMDMGFGRPAVEVALRQSNDDTQAALNLLLDPSFVPPVSADVPIVTAMPAAVPVVVPAYQPPADGAASNFPAPAYRPLY